MTQCASLARTLILCAQNLFKTQAQAQGLGGVRVSRVGRQAEYVLCYRPARLVSSLGGEVLGFSKGWVIYVGLGGLPRMSGVLGGR